jgi:peptidoglycan/xylan/chitin deacetylase (PgdA/CDA1 family)
MTARIVRYLVNDGLRIPSIGPRIRLLAALLIFVVVIGAIVEVYKVTYPRQVIEQPPIQFRSDRWAKSYTLISDFENVALWTKTHGSAIANDTVNFKEGSQGIKLTSVDETYTAANLPVTLNLTNTHFTFWLYVDNEDNVSAASVQFYGSPTSKYFNAGIGGLYSGWNQIMLSRADFTAYGGAVDADWTTITLVGVVVNSKAGVTLNVTLDDMRAVNDHYAGKVTLRFDDGLTSHYTVARERMDTYGYRGVSAVITAFVGTTGYLTLSQLKDMQDRGWDIVSHSVTHRFFTELTDPEVISELGDSQKWLIDNGFIKGSRFLICPGNTLTTSQFELIRAVYIGSYGRAQAEGSSYPYFRSIPPFDPYNLGNGFPVTSSTPLGDVEAYLDKVKTYNAWGTVYFHDLTGMEALFQSIIDYIHSIGVEVVTLSDIFDDTLTSLPESYINQDVKTTASPTFSGATIGSLSGILKATAGVVSGGATAADIGASASKLREILVAQFYGPGIGVGVTSTSYIPAYSNCPTKWLYTAGNGDSVSLYLETCFKMDNAANITDNGWWLIKHCS